MADLIQFRRDTAERWAAANPVLAEGELGLILGSSNQYKMGDGVTPWNSLPIKGFNGNIFDGLGSDYDAVISQAGLTLLLKNIINNGSNVKLSEIDNLNKETDMGWYAIIDRLNSVIGHMLITADPMGHTVNQWVFGNYTIDGNQISTNHTDGRHSILIRSYYLGSNLNVSQENVWTKWKYYQQEFIKSTQNDYSDDGEQWTYGAKSIRQLVIKVKTSLQEEVDKLNNSMTAAFKETNTNVSNLDKKFNELVLENKAGFAVQQNNIAKLIVGIYNFGTQVIFAKGYIYVLSSIPVDTLGSGTTQAPNRFVNALDAPQTITAWGYYNVLALDKDGNIAQVDDTLIKVRRSIGSQPKTEIEVVMRENTNHIYVIGDDLSDSGFSTYSMSYVAKLKAMYDKVFNFIGYNAVSGNTTLQGYNRLQAFFNAAIDENYGQNWPNRIENYQVTADTFRGVCVYIGTNDIVQQTDLSTFITTYTEMLTYITEKFTEANIFVIVPPKCNKKANAAEYCDAIKDICVNVFGISFVDLSTIDELDSTQPDYDYRTYYLEDDCIHLNQAGWDLVNALVIPQFADAMQDRLFAEVSRLSSN